MSRRLERLAAQALRGRTDGRRPRAQRISLNPLGLVLDNLSTLQRSQQVSLGVNVHASLAALQYGRADEADMGHLICAANMAWALTTGRADAQCATMAAEAAQEALRSIGQRHERTARWGATGQEITALATMADLHDQLMAHCTQAEILAALAKVQQACIEHTEAEAARGEREAA